MNQLLKLLQQLDTSDFFSRKKNQKDLFKQIFVFRRVTELFGGNPIYQAVDQDREQIFEDYIFELRKKEKV